MVSARASKNIRSRDEIGASCLLKGEAEVWLGDCLGDRGVEQTLGKRVADALIFDAPYSDKTHAGHEAGRLSPESAGSFADKHDAAPTPESRYARNISAKNKDGRRAIDYGCFDAAKIGAFCSLWLPRCTGWVVSVTDHVLAPIWSAAFEAADLLTFAPLPLVETGSRVRLSGDGPSNWACWIVAARPRSKEFAKWGTLPGAYVQAAERDINAAGGSDRIVGGKPLRSMCGIVRDYSRRGQLVVDPFCGGGTTGLAARQLGRRFIGIESNAERAKLSARRIGNQREQTDLFEKPGVVA